MHDMIVGTDSLNPIGYEGAQKAAYRDDVTLRQNIDQKIARFKAEIAELEASKEQLAPLLDMRLDLMCKAMQR